MKSLLFVFLSLFLITSKGCAASFWKGWGKGIGAGKTAGVDDLPAGSMPASRLGNIQPRRFRSFETWSGYSWYESGEQVYIQEVYLLDGTVKRSFVKERYMFGGSFEKINYYFAPTTTDPSGWKSAGTVYGPRRPNLKK